MFLVHSLILITFCLFAHAQYNPATRSPSIADFSWPTQYVRSGVSNLQVIVQGSGPAVIIVPSLGRDAGSDFNYFSTSLSAAGYLVLRPQPRGTLGSTGPLTNVSIDDLALDVANVIDALGGGKAIVIGHAFGHFIAQVVAAKYPEKVPAIVFAAAQTGNPPANISQTPFLAGNLSLPIKVRLEALRLGFFAAGHDARIWLRGWHPEVLRMEREAIASWTGNMSEIAAGGKDTRVLQVIGDDDPFEVRSERGDLETMFPERVTSVTILDASHALFPEQPAKVVEAVLPWLKAQTSKLNSRGGDWDEL